MSYKFLTLSFSIIYATLNASDTIQYAVTDKHAFLPNPKQLNLSVHYNKVDNDIDVLNLKSTESIDASYGEIGDLQGFGIKLRYAFNDSIAVFAKYEQDSIEYSSQTLDNERIDIFIKYNLSNIVTFDFGFLHNGAKNLDIKNEAMLNGMIHKLSPTSNIHIDDGVIYKNNDKFVLYENGNKIYPYITINNAQDNSFYFRLLKAKRFSEQTLFDFYAGVKFTQIDGEISLEPSSNSIIESTFEKYQDLADLSRTEITYDIGLNLSYSFFTTFFFEFNYQFDYSNRDSSLDYITSNHTIKSYIGSKIFDNSMIYIGGQAMYRQFNNEIPYLYNKYSQTTFDHKYGYAEIGFNYYF
jgi:hypothetical protein